MEHTIRCEWKGKSAFNGYVQGHTVVLDDQSAEDSDNLGPSPKRLLLLSLAGCTGMDVIMIVEKMRIAVDAFEVKVRGNVAETHPKIYTDITLVYEFTGKGLEAVRDKLSRAVELSQEKYCAVSAMIEKAVSLKTEIIVNESKPR